MFPDLFTKAALVETAGSDTAIAALRVATTIELGARPEVSLKELVQQSGLGV